MNKHKWIPKIYEEKEKQRMNPKGQISKPWTRGPGKRI